MTTTIYKCDKCNTTICQMNYENEHYFHERMRRNICLHCNGSGNKGDKSISYTCIGNQCTHCMGTGKRFQNLLKDGILEF